MTEWNHKVKRLLKSELVKRGLSTEDLTLLLNQHGIAETKSSVDSKISRGTFSAAFFLQCLYVIGCARIEVEEYKPLISIAKPLMVAESNIEYKNTHNEY